MKKPIIRVMAALLTLMLLLTCLTAGCLAEQGSVIMIAKRCPLKELYETLQGTWQSEFEELTIDGMSITHGDIGSDEVIQCAFVRGGIGMTWLICIDESRPEIQSRVQVLYFEDTGLLYLFEGANIVTMSRCE